MKGRQENAKMAHGTPRKKFDAANEPATGRPPEDSHPVPDGVVIDVHLH